MEISLMLKLRKTLLKLICSLSVSAIYTPVAFADCDFTSYSESGYGQKAGRVSDKGLIYSDSNSSNSLVGRIEFVKSPKKNVVEAVNVYSKAVEWFQKDGKSYKKSKLTSLVGSIKVYNDGQRNIYNAEGEQIAFLTGEATINRLADTKEVGSFSLNSDLCFGVTANTTKKKKAVRKGLSSAAAGFIISYAKIKAEEKEASEDLALLDL